MRLSIAILSALLLFALPRSVAAQEDTVRQITVSDRSIVPLKTRLRFTTMIILPPGDDIAEVICGDRDYWIISAGQNIAHVKPARQDASTNLNLVTSAGIVYSFLLTENQNGAHDLKVYVNNENTTLLPPRPQASEADVTALRTALDAERAAVARAQKQADDAVAAFKQQYPPRLQFVYGIPKYERPFLIRGIWHDGQFTYLKTDARELPALYEIKDGQPALINFTVQHGLYVVPKVVERGYLALGKKRFLFTQVR